MVKASTKVILQGKFKPWRKGKSEKSRKTGSLKNQLRSKKRLLLKITDEQQRASIKEDMVNLEKAMEVRQGQDREKKNASKYHQVKFVERQKLTRLEKKCKRDLDEAKAAADFDDVEKHTKELEKICMDQLYVAHYPNDTKYISLFANGVRLQDDEKTAKKREEIRNQIVERIKNREIDTKKSWVNMAVLEAKGFAVDMANTTNEEGGKDSTGVKMSAVMKEATAAAAKKKPSTAKNGNNSDSSSAPSSNDGESSSEDDSVEPTKDNSISVELKDIIPTVGESDSSDSDSSDSSSSDSDGEDENNEEVSRGVVNNDDNDVESEDDFLVDDSGDKDITHVFANAKREIEDYKNKGDKSKGWKTQNQRPGEFKKKRDRY